MNEIPDQVLQAVKEAAADGRIACAKAQELAIELQVPMLVVGAAADHLNIRITKCQLGSF
ncbi:MAG: hypothetical protein ACYC2T_11050 [Bacillota bacterium]